MTYGGVELIEEKTKQKRRETSVTRLHLFYRILI